MPESDTNQHSTQEFVQLLNSFKGVEGDIRKMAEVLNEKTDKEKEAKQLKASKDQTDKFANLAEKFDLFLREAKDSRKEASDSAKENEKDKKTSSDSQKVILEEMYATLTRSNVDRRTGETEKDPGGKEETKKTIKSLGEQITESIKSGFKNSVQTPIITTVNTAGTIAGELFNLLIGGGALIALGKILGVPLADAVWDYIKSSWNVFSDFMTEKMGGWWTAIQTGLVLVVAQMIGLLGAIRSVVGGILSAAAREGSRLLGAGAAAAEATTAARAARTAAATTEGAEAVAATSALTNTTKAATSTMGIFAKTLAWLGPVVSGLSAKFNYDDAKKYEAAGLTGASGMKTTALGLDLTSAGLGVAGLLAGASTAPLLLGAAAVTGLGGAAYSYFADKKAETEKAQKKIEVDTTNALEKLIVDSKKESEALLAKAKEGLSYAGTRAKSLFDTSTESKIQHQQDFSDSVGNLESAIDKSINALMDWDRRNLNPIQAISEMMRGMTGPKKSNPGSANPVTTRDQVHDYRKSYRLQLGTAG